MREAGFSEADNAFIIAEIGTSHRGDIARARAMVDAAAEAGADCVKTQIVYAEEIVHPRTGSVDLPGGQVPLFQRFRELEVSPDFFSEMAAYCTARGVSFLASVFGTRSLADLRALGADTVKIASPELNHYPLLLAVAETGLDSILSTGVSTLSDIERALEVVGREASSIMHCVTAYPTPEEEYNLGLIPNLACILGVPVGLSDHSVDPELVPATAVALGARMVEKHFTLSRTDGGLDDPIALEPRDFAAMVSAIRDVEAAVREAGVGAVSKRRGQQLPAPQRPGPCAGATGAVPAAAWPLLSERFGPARVEAVVGDGIKRLAPSEAESYGSTNRSVIAVRDIEAGEPVSGDNAAILRSEKNLEPGLSPFLWDDILGARAACGIPSGTGILWHHLLSR